MVKTNRSRPYCSSGGADTTVSSEYAFFLAMVLFPEVQKKAQDEIDAVVGNERLPTFADQSQLPYVNAIVTELMRWNNVVPLGLAFIISGRFYFIDRTSRCTPRCISRRLRQWLFHSQGCPHHRKHLVSLNARFIISFKRAGY